jgi:hypothetical protein
MILQHGRRELVAYLVLLASINQIILSLLRADL